MRSALPLAFCFLLSLCTAVANATIIVTPTISLLSQNTNTATYSVRATITTNATDAPVANTVTSYGFTVNLSSATAFTLVSPGIIPAQLLGNGPGFESEFSHQAVLTPVVGNSVTFSGQNQSVATRNLSDNDASRFRVFTFTVNKLGSPFTLNVAVAPANVLSAGPGLVGGLGFVNSAGTSIPANFTATASTGITAVPEPSSVAMLAIAGVLGFGVRMRSWKAKRKLASDNC